MLITLNLDTRGFKNKPLKTDVPGVKYRIARNIRSIDSSDLADYIQRGIAFSPCQTNSMSGSGWISQQIFCVDVDNDYHVRRPDGKQDKFMIDNPLTVDEAVSFLINQYGISPYLIYESYSCTPEWPRYRVVFITSEPVLDSSEAMLINSKLIHTFNHIRPRCTDTSTKDLARIFYGSHGNSVRYTDNTAFLDLSVLRALPMFADDSSKKQSSGSKHAKSANTGALEKSGRPDRSTKSYRSPAQNKSAYYSGNPHLSYPKQVDGHRSLTALQEIFNYDKDNFDLEQYVLDTTTGDIVVVGNTRFINPCPICNHNNDFAIDGHQFYCHGGTGNDASGSIIDYLMMAEHLDLAHAIDKFKFNLMEYDREEWDAADYDAFLMKRDQYKGIDITRMSELANASKANPDWESLPFLDET